MYPGSGGGAPLLQGCPGHCLPTWAKGLRGPRRQRLPEALGRGWPDFLRGPTLASLARRKMSATNSLALAMAGEIEVPEGPGWGRWERGWGGRGATLGSGVQGGWEGQRVR